MITFYITSLFKGLLFASLGDQLFCFYPYFCSYCIDLYYIVVTVWVTTLWAALWANTCALYVRFIQSCCVIISLNHSPGTNYIGVKYEAWILMLSCFLNCGFSQQSRTAKKFSKKNRLLSLGGVFHYVLVLKAFV